MDQRIINNGHGYTIAQFNGSIGTLNLSNGKETKRIGGLAGSNLGASEPPSSVSVPPTPANTRENQNRPTPRVVNQGLVRQAVRKIAATGSIDRNRLASTSGQHDDRFASLCNEIYERLERKKETRADDRTQNNSPTAIQAEQERESRGAAGGEADYSFGPEQEMSEELETTAIDRSFQSDADSDGIATAMCPSADSISINTMVQGRRKRQKAKKLVVDPKRRRYEYKEF